MTKIKKIPSSPSGLFLRGGGGRPCCTHRLCADIISPGHSTLEDYLTEKTGTGTHSGAHPSRANMIHPHGNRSTGRCPGGQEIHERTGAGEDFFGPPCAHSGGKKEIAVVHPVAGGRARSPAGISLEQPLAAAPAARRRSAGSVPPVHARGWEGEPLLTSQPVSFISQRGPGVVPVSSRSVLECPEDQALPSSRPPVISPSF